MSARAVVLIAEDDPGHAVLVEKNLQRIGLNNLILHFGDGQSVLDFLRNSHRTRADDRQYVLLLDIRMPKIDGVEVLRQIRRDPELRKIPVTMLTTNDDPAEVARCHGLGCSSYIVKPVNYERFSAVVQQLGEFIKLIEVPTLEDAHHDAN
jgi:CheY-like chemotaxis protein